jgi:DNA-binding CsgD family transcriptional regulator
MVVVQNITERRQAEEAARTRQKELEEKTASLEEANAALKVLLSHRDEDKEDLEKRILANVKKLVLPYVEKMKAGRLTDSQAAYVEIIESNLTHIVSPFLQKMATAYSHFTPTEIQVADLIKEGKTTKEIAGLLNIGIGTVNTHRNGIRAKLGLRNKDVNLRSHLLSFE